MTYEEIRDALPTDGMRHSFAVEYGAAGERQWAVLAQWAEIARTLNDPEFHAYAASARPAASEEIA